MKKPNRAEVAETIRMDMPTMAKVGSIIVHLEEARGAGGHPFDWTAADQLLADPEVQKWLGAMRKASLLPAKRS